MKKVFSICCLASLLLLSFAFTPAEKLDVVDCNGRIQSCAITSTSAAIITYDILDETGNSVYTGDVMPCEQDLINLETGEYSIEVNSSHQAWVLLRGEFCPNGLPVTFSNGAGQAIPPNTPTVVIPFFFIP